jgi:bacillithiol synthase
VVTWLCIKPVGRGILISTRFSWSELGVFKSFEPDEDALHLADCHPIAVAPGLSRLYADFCAGEPAVARFFGSVPPHPNWQARPAAPGHWAELIEILASQNRFEAARPAISALRAGSGIVVTGQQVGLLGGPLFTPLKAATALARARQATVSGSAHVAVFWLATEDHDFAEINHVTFPSRGELKKLVYDKEPPAPVPVGGVVLDSSIEPLIEQAWELIGYSDAMEALAGAYKPGRTMAQAFAEFYARIFAAQGLLVFDAGGRESHRIGAPVLRAAVERADEFHAALLERNRALIEAGYHAQVAVAPQSSLLFLIDEQSGSRLALKRQAPSATEPRGLWQAGREKYATEDLLGILASNPERISPAALLRPVFQDFLLGTSLTIGGPAEIAYFAQSAVLFEGILGRITPAEPRFSATLVEPAIGELLRKHELTLERIFTESADSLAQNLAARAMPVEGKRKLAAAGATLDDELRSLLEWMHKLDAGLGRSADTAASKMRYQMNRLRRLAAAFQLQREDSLKHHADAIMRALYPGGVLQERVHGAAYYFGRYGLELAERITTQAVDGCSGHTAIWL